MNNIIMYFVNIILTFFLINRWIVSGHFPLSNLYESLIFLSWSFSAIYTVTSFSLRGDLKKTLLPTIAWSVMPITLLTCTYAIFCIPQELQKADNLVPALQSNWLIMHVSVMILGYASLIIGSLFAFSLLLILHFENNVFPFHNLLTLAFARGNEIFFAKGKGKEVMSVTSKMALASPMMQIQHLSPETALPLPMKPSLPRASSTPLPPAKAKDHMDQATLFSLNTAISLKDSRKADYEVAPAPEVAFEVKDFVAFASGNEIEDFKGKAKEGFKVAKSSSFLDNLSYRFIGLGFALLTLGIISGAVWANSAWGSYWSWDPKETWAFITWLTYAIYLHLRVSKGWSGKQSATVALFGFFVVWFCYLGVNLFGKGLHSYAFV